MEKCYNDTVETLPEKDGGNNISRKYLLRQTLVSSGVLAMNFVYGLSFGSPTVLIPQIRLEANSSDAVSTEMASWLSSTINYSGTVSAIILAILARLIGRKLSFLFVCFTSIIAFIVVYCSRNLTEILISEVLHGPLAATPLTVSTMVVTEYTSPRYRAVFLTLKSAIFLWGIWVANTIGTYFDWKNIGIVGLICSTYSFLTVLLWPESPYWLVNKNKFEKCVASHRWLKGCSKASETELETLIQSKKVEQSIQIKQQNVFKSVRNMVKSKRFYKPFLLSMLVTLMYHFSGKIACTMYAIDIIKRMTATESSAYTGMLILDGVTVLGTYVGCGLSRFLKRRTLLLISSTVGVIFLFCLSIYLYFIRLNVVSENAIVSISLLMGYSLAISVGPMIMASTVSGELTPLKYRSSSVLLLGCFTNFVMACILKISPLVLNYSGTSSLLISFAVIESLFILISYKLLPETKDKSIIEIQECLLAKK